MTISFEIPGGLERDLSLAPSALSAAAKEGFLIHLYRSGLLSIGQIAQALGLETRHQAEVWLGERGVEWNYGVDELDLDRRTLDEFLGTEA
jgi:predicted HTH domain antitoxin